MKRFLVVAPAGRDAQVIQQLLEGAGLEVVVDSDGELLLSALPEGLAAGAVITDDALSRINRERIIQAIANQRATGFSERFSRAIPVPRTTAATMEATDRTTVPARPSRRRGAKRKPGTDA